MAALALAALGSLGVGGGAAGLAGVGAAAAGTAAIGGAAAGSGALAALSGIATAISVIGTIGAGFSAASSARSQADATELEAGQQQLQDAQKATQMKRQLAAVLGQNDVTFANAGIDISQGIAANNRANQNKEASQQLSIDDEDATYRQNLLRQRAQAYRLSAGADIGGALLNALGTGVSGAYNIAKIG